MKRTAVVVAMLAIIAGTAALGQWQLRRAQYKQELELVRQAGLRAEPAVLGHEVPDWGRDTAEAEGRPFTVNGHWLTDKTIFIDNRTHQGVAGFHVVSPLQIESTVSHPQNPSAHPVKVVLVLRGWVAANRRDRNLLPPVQYPPGIQTIRGTANVNLAQTMQLSADTAPGPEDRLWQYFDLAKYKRWSGLNAHSFVLRQTSESMDELIRQWPIPGNGVDRHHGYAFQWFAMSLTATLFMLWLLFKEWSAHRRGRRSAGE